MIDSIVCRCCSRQSAKSPCPPRTLSMLVVMCEYHVLVVVVVVATTGDIFDALRDMMCMQVSGMNVTVAETSGYGSFVVCI